MAFDYKSLIPVGIGAGATLLGGALQSKAANKSSDRQWDLIQQEMARRNAVQGALAPSMMSALGLRNPASRQNLQGSLSGNTPSENIAPRQAAGFVPSTPSSGAAKALGGVAAGAGAAGMLGLSSLAGPVGLIAGAGALGASQIGKGRRTANAGVDAIEKPFGEQLSRIAAGQGGLPELQAAYQSYMNNINAWKSMGGNHQKVAEQSLANAPLQRTVDTLFKTFGGSR